MSDTKYCVYYNVDSHIVSKWEAGGNMLASSVLFALIGAPIKGILGAIGVNVVANFGIDYPAEDDKIEVETTIQYNIDRDQFEYKQVTYHYRPQASGGYKLVNETTVNHVYISGSTGYAGLYGNATISKNMHH